MPALARDVDVAARRARAEVTEQVEAGAQDGGRAGRAAKLARGGGRGG